MQSDGSATKYSKVTNNKEGKLHCDTGEQVKPDCIRKNVEDPHDVSADSSKSKHSNSECESDDEGRLVINCSDFDKSPNSIPSQHVEKNVHLKSSQQTNVENVCKTRLLAKMSYVNQSLCQKLTQSNRDHEMDNKPFSEDTHTGTNGNTQCSEVTNKIYRDTVVPGDGHAAGMNIRNQGECTAVDAEERERPTRALGSTPMDPGFNVSYKLWKLSKDEGHTDDWKEGFLKGDHSNREIKVLVRCKVDGCEVNIFH
jgi:hypothetical protein